MTHAGAQLHWCDDNQAAREAACGDVCPDGRRIGAPVRRRPRGGGQSTCGRGARASARPGCDCSPSRWRGALKRHVLWPWPPRACRCGCMLPSPRTPTTLPARWPPGFGNRRLRPTPFARALRPLWVKFLGPSSKSTCRASKWSMTIRCCTRGGLCCGKLASSSSLHVLSRRRRFDGGLWTLGLPQSRPYPDRGQHRSGPDSRIPQPNRLISR